MGAFTLIPFGLHLKSNQVVDVGSVQNGIKCDCICPSCKTPLIARHGSIKEWHFAHQSRDVKKCKAKLRQGGPFVLKSTSLTEGTMKMSESRASK